MMLARRGGLTRILAQKFITMKFLLNCETLGNILYNATRVYFLEYMVVLAVFPLKCGFIIVQIIIICINVMHWCLKIIISLDAVTSTCILPDRMRLLRQYITLVTCAIHCQWSQCIMCWVETVIQWYISIAIGIIIIMVPTSCVNKNNRVIFVISWLTWQSRNFPTYEN